MCFKNGYRLYHKRTLHFKDRFQNPLKFNELISGTSLIRLLAQMI